MAGELVTADQAGTGVTQAADGQTERDEDKPVLPAEQGGVTPKDAADGAGDAAPGSPAPASRTP